MARFLPSSRFAKLFAIHALISAGLCVYALNRHGAAEGPPLAALVITFLQVFLGSIAGALLGIIQLSIGVFKGFAGTTDMIMFNYPVPVPVIVGAAAIGGFALMVAGIKMFGKKTAYVVFVLASCLLLFSSYIYFVGAATNARPLLGHPVFLQPER